MYILLINVLLSILGGFTDEVEGLVELPQVEDSEILHTENLIRSSTNNIFSSLGLKGVKEKPRLKQYALIHNFFISLTLRDHNTLKDVARLTRVDKNNDNETENFIMLLNEILNGDHSSEILERNTTIMEDVDEDFINYLDSQLKDLSYLKLDYINKNPPADINKEIIDILSRNDELRFNETKNKQETFNDDVAIKRVLGEQSGRRIFKGHHTKIKRHPFVAAIQMFNKFQCGGAIISSDMVITAASCVQLAFNNRLYRENPAFLSVRIGSKYYNSGGEVISVIEVYFHPRYEPKTLQNNLAGLRLSLHIFFHKKVKKIEFDHNAEPLPSNTPKIMIVGWGAKSRSNIVKGPWENKLSVDELPFYPLRDCQEIYAKESVTEKNFCAGYNAKGSGACNSDAGNPGVASGRLVGIVSFGAPVCGAPDYPTVFTKLGYYVDWIDTVLLERGPMKSVKRKTLSKYFFDGLTKQGLPGKLTTISNTTKSNMQPINLIRAKKTDSSDIEDLELDKEMFRDFLGTMFNSSKEVQDYMDIVEETGNIKKICKTCKAGENVKPEKILESIGDRFKNDSLIFETIYRLKSRLERNANKSSTKNDTHINKYFDLSDIDVLSKNNSKELEKTDTNTTADISKQDELVGNSLLDDLVASSKKNALVTSVPKLPFTKMANEMLDENEFRVNSKSNYYNDTADNIGEEGLNIKINKGKDNNTLLLSNKGNKELWNPVKLIDKLKTPQHMEEIMYRTLDDNYDEGSSKYSSSEESLILELPQGNLNSTSKYNNKSIIDDEKNHTDDLSKLMTFNLKLGNLLAKVQNEIVLVPNLE